MGNKSGAQLDKLREARRLEVSELMSRWLGVRKLPNLKAPRLIEEPTTTIRQTAARSKKRARLSGRRES